jgi:thiosulfate/3-mercaptopyruvate sulfurtransferase
MTYTHPEYLISTDQLAQKINSNPHGLLVFDVTVTLVPNPPGYRAVSGREDYLKEHIPGAAFMDLMTDLSDTTSGLGFTLPSMEQLQSAYREAGISDDSQVVFYSTGHMMWATRAWWMLHSCGHKNVAVLDGGFAKWKEENRDLSDTVPGNPAGNMSVKLNQEQWVDKEKTSAAINDAGICTINALSPGVYSGSAEMNYGRKGHIENSKNVYYDDVLSDGCFRPADELATLFSDKGVLESPRVIAYCGGGISATIDALALTLIGHNNVAVYDGSMSEWVKDESLPLIEGPEPGAA